MRKGRDRERLFHEISSSEFKGADHEIGGLNLRIAAGWQVVLRPNERLGLVLRRTRFAHELETVVSDGGDAGDVFAEQVARQAEERASQLDALEWELDARSERLTDREAHLTVWEQQIRTQRMSGAPGRAVAKVGRNERCPCGSGMKYKHCHGHAGHRT